MSVVRRLLPFALCACLAPGVASAKELGAVGVCGADGCRSADTSTLDEGILQAGAWTGPPSSGAPFYRVMLQMRVPGGQGEAPRWEVIYVPSKGLLRTQQDDRPIWVTVPAETRRLYDRVVAGVRPFPAAELPGVRHRAAPSAAGGDGVPAWLIVLAGAGALAAAGAFVVRRRGALAGTPPGRAV